MTQNEIIKMARKAGLEADGVYFSDAMYRAVLVRFAHLVAAKATQQEQDRCCAIVFGQCESDNVAQRTVNAIRDKA